MLYLKVLKEGFFLPFLLAEGDLRFGIKSQTQKVLRFPGVVFFKKLT